MLSQKQWKNCIRHGLKTENTIKLSDIGIITDDPPAFQFLDVTLSILAKEIGDTYGYVQFFVFDMDWGDKKKVYDPNSDTFIDLDDFGELFDYIQERNKQ